MEGDWGTFGSTNLKKSDTHTMGIFSRKPKPAFVHPEVPLENVRRGSVFDKIRSSISFESPQDGETGLTHGTQQTTFLGRKVSQTFVPAFARKASLAIAERDRNPAHLRMGESIGGGDDKFNDAFFGARLVYDDASDEEFDEKLAERRKLSKGKGKADWQGDLGWQQPKSEKALAKEAKKRERQKRRHRSKRAMKEFDDNLTAFNEFTRNGIKGAVPNDESTTSLPSLFQHPGIAKPEIGLLEDESALPKESTKRAVLVGDGYDALDVMADHIFRIGCQKKKWFKAPRMGSKKDTVGTGVTIRAKVGVYRTFPVAYAALDEFEEAIARLNPEVAIKIKSDIVTSIMRTYM